MATLKDFWQSGDDGKLAFKSRTIKDKNVGLHVQAFVEITRFSQLDKSWSLGCTALEPI